MEYLTVITKISGLDSLAGSHYRPEKPLGALWSISTCAEGVSAEFHNKEYFYANPTLLPLLHDCLIARGRSGGLLPYLQ